MGFKEVLSKIGEKNRERKQRFRQMEENLRMQKMLEDRQMSSNERELMRFQKEEREENIKEALEYMRKKREQDIRFNHNPLDTPNITNKTDWEVMNEKNMFKGDNNRCIFAGESFIHKSNSKLLKNNKRLFGI